MKEIDLAATAEAIRRASGNLADLLHEAADSSRRAGRLDWSIGDTAAHVVGGFAYYAEYLPENVGGSAGRSTLRPANTAEQTAIGNAQRLAAFSERNPARLADLLGPTTEAFLTTIKGCDEASVYSTSTGVAMTARTIAATALGELLIHGLDIAEGLGVRWKVERYDSLLVLAGIVPLLPHYLDSARTQDLNVAYEIRLRGGGCYRLSVTAGRATVTAAGERVDCSISADPTDFLLLGYQRVGRWGRVLRGGILAGGTKPWLALRFGSLLTTI